MRHDHQAPRAVQDLLEGRRSQWFRVYGRHRRRRRQTGRQGQTQQILKEIDRLLRLGGTDKSKLVSATIWVTDIRNRDAMNEAWNAWTGGENLPGRACIEAALADPRMLVEIAVVAAK